ncbi:MAG: hypothetical protein HUU21_28810 [Polyangiaceae bacterium]|nr:hypothetical protein [Polyangiaceae bacterium]
MRPRAFSLVVFASALALAVPAAVLVNPVPEAHAAVSVLLSLDELVGATSHVVVAQAGESRSVWEDLPGGRRIVTYTKLHVERPIGGSSPGEVIEVRTLGGIVGEIGQAVEGDAKMVKGERAVFFLVKGERAAVVAGRAQGHFPLRADEKGTVRLVPSPKAGKLLPRPGPVISAREELSGALLEDAVTRIEKAWKARHGR